MKNEENEIINKLLDIDHQTLAYKARFISKNRTEFSYELLLQALGLLDKLSRKNDEISRRKIILITALIWSYKKTEWVGLKDFLIPILSRSGFAPTSIMIDKEYDKKLQKFSHSNSFFSELDIVSNQLKYEISINSKTYLLTAFQKLIWDKMNTAKLLGISAPTSAGKSYIILLKALEMLLEKSGCIIYIVPTLSLVSQVSMDFEKLLKEYKLNNYSVCNAYNENIKKDTCIYVLTQEKAIAAFEHIEIPFKNVRLLVIDEIQNLEKVANDSEQRAKILYDTIIEFRHLCKADFTIIAGPRIEKLKNLGIEIFGESNSDDVETKDSPVVSLTYSISKNDRNFYFNQYCDLFNQPKSIIIQQNQKISWYQKTKYNDTYFKYFIEFFNNVAKNQINVVFSPTAITSETIAIKIASSMEHTQSEKLKSLSVYIRENVHQEYNLANIVLKEIIYHHGKLPMNIRIVIERAIKDNLIKTIVATTTLMQGINMPAQNLFMRTPYLSGKKQSDGAIPKLSNYEIANLRGRTGRLMSDLIGRTFVMDESSFISNNEENQGLFEPVKKTLDIGYGNIFKKNETEIRNNINSTNELRNLNSNTLLTIYIRQMILKYGLNSKKRLDNVKIDIPFHEIKKVQTLLNTLEIPKEICFKNRYWDPFVLNQIYIKRAQYKVPHLNDPSFTQIMADLLCAIKNDFPEYCNRYVKYDINKKKKAKHLAILIQKWITETTLKEILSDKYYDSQKKIFDCVNELNSIISYGVSMLLKPFYDINAPDNSIVSFIEMGAYKPLTKKLIELNIPRETAIYLQQNYFIKKQEYSLDEIHITLNKIQNEVDYWIKIQFEHLL